MAKQRIEIIASEETYKNLQSFKNIKELNDTVRAYKERYGDELTKSALNVLNLLHRYSAKYTGVSFMNKNTIAKHLGISRRTVVRACNQLESLGIIKQYEMKRKSDMLQTGNAIVIQPIEEENKENKIEENDNDAQENEHMTHHENNTSLKQKTNIKNLNNKRRPYIKLVPKSLQHFQAYFGKAIKDIYGRVWLAAKKLNIKPNKETMQNIGRIVMEKLKEYIKEGRDLTKEKLCIIAWKISHNQLTQRLESGEIIDYGYEYRHLLDVIDQKEKRGEKREIPPFYNWLECEN